MKKNILGISFAFIIILAGFAPLHSFAQQYSAAECASFRAQGMVSMEPYCTGTSSTTTSTPTSNNISNGVTFNAPAAQSCAGNSSLGNLICNAQQILNSIVPLLIGLGVVYFVWGVVTYFIASDEEAKSTGRDRIIYGIIGLAVIIGVWGLVGLVVNTFKLNATVPSAAIANLVPTAAGSCPSLANSPNFQVVLNYFTCIIDQSLIPLIFAVAMVAFVWGAVNFFIINADEEAKREQGKQFMIWGIIALAVMLSVWGLVGIITNTFHFNGSVLPHVSPYQQ